MSKSAKTIYVFFIYMIISGLGFVFIPNIVLNLVGLPASSDIWVRAVGMMTILLGSYYGVMAKNEVKSFFYAASYGRLTVILFFTGFVLFDLAPLKLIMFGVVDLLGAIWTLRTLRTENKE